jgi:ribosomal protein L32E
VDPVALEAANKDSGWRRDRGRTTMRHEMDMTVESVQAMYGTRKRPEKTTV